MEAAYKKNLAECLISLGIAAGMFALGYYSGMVLLVFFSLFIPMAFIYARAASGTLPAVLLLAAFCVFVFFTAGYRYAVTALCCFLPPALVTGFMIRKKHGFYYSVLASCAAISASLLILLLCISLLWQGSLYDLLLGRIEAVFAANPEASKVYYHLMGIMQGGNTVNYGDIDLGVINAIPAQTAYRAS